jgi:hypothetical protein
LSAGLIKKGAAVNQMLTCLGYRVAVVGNVLLVFHIGTLDSVPLVRLLFVCVVA